MRPLSIVDAPLLRFVIGRLTSRQPAEPSYLAGMRTALAALVMVGSVTVANATMDPMKDKPTKLTGESCRIWAEQQSEDTTYLWGMKEDGNSLKDLAVFRLAANCLGDPKPEIVGFGSSDGFDRAYCQRHTKAQICSRRR